MPVNLANEILTILESQENPKILILGYSYKANVGDTRETPVKPLSFHLKEYGCEVIIHDPLVEKDEIPDEMIVVADPTKCEDLDLIILATSHEEYSFSNRDFWTSISSSMKKPIIFDGRRTLPKNKMQDSGWVYYGVGSPHP